MTERVDFYVLTSTAARQRWIFACRLTEKAYQRALQIVVWGGDDAEVSSVDELLWTYDERSFLPHDVADASRPDARAPGTAPAPIRLTADLASVGGADLLVNLTGKLPPSLERFARIAEIVDGDEDRRRLGRERFKVYRDLKLPVETHRS